MGIAFARPLKLFTAILLMAAVSACQGPRPTWEQLGGMDLAAERDGEKFQRIEVEDVIEAGLIEQELGIRPEKIVGRSFYYWGTEELNRRLADFGFNPVAAHPRDIATLVVRAEGRRPLADLREAGILVILEEPDYLIVRVTPPQIRTLSDWGFRLEPLKEFDPRPRNVSVRADTRRQISDQIAPEIDIYHVDVEEQGFVVHGGAFDYAIRNLRDLGFEVTIEPDFPGVQR